MNRLIQNPNGTLLCCPPEPDGSETLTDRDRAAGFVDLGPVRVLYRGWAFPEGGKVPTGSRVAMHPEGWAVVV